ncbi:MAG: glutamyl-tRNA reductase [Flavobacteriaceae bacterium]|jgi:glutamyl-tRNA reductase|nr:glutamyl-tRNA reductase [Flavobacteriaceae bacterium]
MKEAGNNKKRKFFAISLSYEKANAEIRGKFTFFPEFIESFAQTVREILPDTKIFVLSTCNRTELYAQTADIESIINIYCKQINVSPEQFRQYINIFEENEALRHFLRVSCGLESQILGDFEIISQVKVWFKRFKKTGTTGAFLERLVNMGIQTSKKIKSSTALSNGATSVSYAAVNYILKNCADLSHKKITLIGTGKIGNNTCRNLLKHIENPNITLINRTLSKAQEMAERLGLQHQDFSQLYSVINDSDVVIVATGAPQSIIRKENITTQKPLILIDLSVPENVSHDVKELKNITLLNVDDLSKTINETFRLRSSEIPKAEKIIEEMLKEFNIWRQNRKYVPVIHAFKSDLERIKEYQIKTLKKSQKEISESEQILSDKIAQKITNRLADYLIENPDKAEVTIDLFKEMFQLQVAEQR